MANTELVLGKKTAYANEYAPYLLQRIPRELGRSRLKHLKPFYGMDLWRLYEMTYLGPNGLPRVCMGIMKVPASSDYIVESKSLKLYEMSYTMTKFTSLSDVKAVFERDLSGLLECSVEVELYEVPNKAMLIENVSGTCLEALACAGDLNLKKYEYNPKYLVLEDDGKAVSRSYYTSLFRSLCPVTSQPDHATVCIDYKGRRPSESGLLSYLVSLRNHQGFHEQCVELIFSDIMHYLEPVELTVSAYFTRRGGIDINPVRTTVENYKYASLRTIRQ